MGYRPRGRKRVGNVLATKQQQSIHFSLYQLLRGPLTLQATNARVSAPLLQE